MFKGVAPFLRNRDPLFSEIDFGKINAILVASGID
jgi:hypothetical protein